MVNFSLARTYLFHTSQQIKLLIQLSGVGVNPNEFQYDIEIYKVLIIPFMMDQK